MERTKEPASLRREGPDLEYKSASKGIPGSTWETSSAFSNTDGGRIVLGVAEDDDGEPFVEGVTKPEVRVQEVWNTLNNPQVISANILREDDVRTEEMDGVPVVVIDVPRADRFIRPVYYKRMDTGTFKRNGEGDYRCTLMEIASMLRDRSETTYDSTILDDTGFDDIDPDTLHAFRNTMATHSPDHMWNSVDDAMFAEMVNAVGRRGSDRPLTVAGLLMFGREYLIYNRFPDFKLDYREYSDNSSKWTFRVVTGDGTWCGNVFNFYLRVSQRMTSDLDRPRDIGPDMRRIDDTEVHMAVRECLLNALIHTDYPGHGGIRIERRPDRIIVSNPGLFRIPLEVAERGGESDPRNGFMAKMFSMVGAVERAGSGVSFVFRTWDAGGRGRPSIDEDQAKQRVTVTLPLRAGIRKVVESEDVLLDLIRLYPGISIAGLSERTGLSKSTVYKRITDLRASGRIERVGGTRGMWRVDDTD